ncbi:Cyclic nucleotide-binding protein [Pseudocohnilembus persalinus]|uniref:Cyclic nucleotide-binding protein n=1 Tax=Pseudocohnilembus persalinus TaxID=266149 RepID=A0A0V0QRA8_PSEPJ|nr:Cyclic nucleotide-binding protein [Pseudocohnilembus persalinus]|eukprot:KRX04809.1 Cyclic nucleotide-binding protein [Pseudocohnilembus persalinus]
MQSSLQNRSQNSQSIMYQHPQITNKQDQSGTYLLDTETILKNLNKQQSKNLKMDFPQLNHYNYIVQNKSVEPENDENQQVQILGSNNISQTNLSNLKPDELIQLQSFRSNSSYKRKNNLKLEKLSLQEIKARRQIMNEEIINSKNRQHFSQNLMSDSSQLNQHQLFIQKNNEEHLKNMTLEQREEYKQKIKQAPKLYDNKWKRLKQFLFLQVKCSAIFSPFLIQTQINDLSAAYANTENLDRDIIDRILKKQKSLKKQFFEKIFEIYQKIPIFDNTNIYSILIDVLFFILGVAFVFVISIDVFFAYGKLPYSLQLWGELFFLIASVLFLSHLCAILYHTLGQIEINYLNVENSWLQQGGIIDDSIMERYMTSLFCATSSMITVLVYVPQTIYERIYQTIIMILNCGVFGYTINEQKLELNLEEANQVINKLSQHLQEDLKKDVYKQYLDNIPIFQNKFSDKLISKMYDIIEEETYTDEEYIIQENQLQQDIFYLIKGSVQIVQNVGKREMSYTFIKKIEPGQYFGHVEFFTGLYRTSSVQCEKFSTLIRIPKEKFIKILQNTEIKGIKKDFQHFCMLRDQILRNEFYRIDAKCFTCNRGDHLSRDCPNTHMIFNSTKKKRLLQSHDHIKRKKIKRKNKKYAQLQNKKDINQVINQFLDYKEQEIEIYDCKYHYADKDDFFSGYDETYFNQEDLDDLKRDMDTSMRQKNDIYLSDSNAITEEQLYSSSSNQLKKLQSQQNSPKVPNQKTPPQQSRLELKIFDDVKVQKVSSAQVYSDSNDDLKIEQENISENTQKYNNKNQTSKKVQVLCNQSSPNMIKNYFKSRTKPRQSISKAIQSNSMLKSLQDEVNLESSKYLPLHIGRNYNSAKKYKAWLDGQNGGQEEKKKIEKTLQRSTNLLGKQSIMSPAQIRLLKQRNSNKIQSLFNFNQHAQSGSPQDTLSSQFQKILQMSHNNISINNNLNHNHNNNHRNSINNEQILEHVKKANSEIHNQMNQSKKVQKDNS